MTPIEFRRYLHAHAELSFHEHGTQRFIMEQLQKAGIECRPIAKTGVLARICGDRGRTVVLRADIDALPIHEEVDVAWKSQNEGVMHACGHDLHAAVLYGVLLRLKDASFDGQIYGLFQPAEEVAPGGAVEVLKELDATGELGANVVFIGEHVEPEMATGTLGFRAGTYMASSDEIRATVRGRGGHAALRAALTDTVSAASQLVLLLTAMTATAEDGGRVVSIGKLEAAGATNIIPDSVYMEGTMRVFNEAERGELKNKILAEAAANDRQYGTTTEVVFTEGYPCVVNDEALTQRAIALARKMDIAYTEPLPLRMTSDDFGYYTQRYPSLYYRLGVGPNVGALHTSTFNPNEDAIAVAVDYMTRLASDTLQTTK